MLRIEDMSKQERDLLRAQINEVDMKEIQQRLCELEKQKEVTNERMKLIEEQQNKQDEETEEIKSQINVLCSPIHHSRLRSFRNKASARVRELLGVKFEKGKKKIMTPEYILFAPYFYKGIYSDICYQLEFDGTYTDLPMTDWEEPDSMFGQAKVIRDKWKPSYRYYNRVLQELKSAAANNLLPDERKEALNLFLKSTNNGVDVAFIG